MNLGQWFSSLSMGAKLGIVWASVFACVPIAFVIVWRKEKAKLHGKASIEQQQKMHNKYLFYSKNVLLRKRFRNIQEQFSSLACYSVEQAKEESVILFEQTLKASLLIPAVSFLITKDMVLTLLMALVAYVYYDKTVDCKIDKVKMDIYIDESIACQSIREKFMETHSIPTAVLKANYGKYLYQPLQMIYEIVSATNGKELLLEFYRTSPLLLLRTLATTCYNCNESGDMEVGADSAFAKSIMVVRRDVDTEIRRLTKIKLSFKGLSILALVGIGVTPLLDWYLLSQIPGTSVLIKGLYGQIEKTILIILTIITYYVISVLTRPSIVDKKDKSVAISRLCNIPAFRKIVDNVKPKKYKDIVKVKKLIDGSLSAKDVEYVYASKIVYSAIGYIATIILLLCFTIIARSNVINNYGSLGFVPDKTAYTVEQYRQIKLVDKEYMSSDKKPSDEEALKMVRTIKGLDTLGYDSQVSRLSKKWDTYNALQFNWFYWFIAAIGGAAGWFLPEVMLKFRRKLVEFEAAEDVAQLQTLMIVLHTSSMDVRRVLYWMSKQSTIHKAAITYAYYEYTSDPLGSLDRLKRKCNNEDMKALITKLQSAVYKLPLRDAFSDMPASKEQSLVVREMVQNEAIESKKQWAKLLCTAPILIALICGFVLVIIILGFTEMVDMMAALQS